MFMFIYVYISLIKWFVLLYYLRLGSISRVIHWSLWGKETEVRRSDFRHGGWQTKANWVTASLHKSSKRWRNYSNDNLIYWTLVVWTDMWQGTRCRKGQMALPLCASPLLHGVSCHRTTHIDWILALGRGSRCYMCQSLWSWRKPYAGAQVVRQSDEWLVMTVVLQQPSVMCNTAFLLSQSCKKKKKTGTVLTDRAGSPLALTMSHIFKDN